MLSIEQIRQDNQSLQEGGGGVGRQKTLFIIQGLIALFSSLYPKLMLSILSSISTFSRQNIFMEPFVITLFSLLLWKQEQSFIQLIFCIEKLSLSVDFSGK